jgi:hypothetical protein
MISRTVRGHQYQIQPHTTSELGPLALKLAALATGPVLTFLRGIGTEGSIAEMDLSQIDPSALQQSLLTLAQNLSGEELRMLFSGCSRDNKHLSDPINYDKAFQGNWTEFFLALKEILSANGFLDFLDSSAGTD